MKTRIYAAPAVKGLKIRDKHHPLTKMRYQWENTDRKYDHLGLTASYLKFFMAPSHNHDSSTALELNVGPICRVAATLFFWGGPQYCLHNLPYKAHVSTFNYVTLYTVPYKPEPQIQPHRTRNQGNEQPFHNWSARLFIHQSCHYFKNTIDGIIWTLPVSQKVLQWYNYGDSVVRYIVRCDLLLTL